MSNSPGARSPSLTEVSPRPTPRRGFKRNSAACERCRKRKQKCDGKLPTCGPCATAGSSCVPSERLVVRVDPNCQCAALRDRVQQLEARIECLTASGNTDGPSHETLRPQSAAPVVNEPQPSGLSVRNVDAISYRGRILRPTFAGQNAQEPSFWSSPWHLWSDDADNEPSPSAIDALSLPIAEYGDGLIDVFFTHRWPQLPILHKPTFLEQHYYPLVNGTRFPCDLSAFQVYMVFAIASAETGPPVTRHRYAHRDFFQRAIRDLNVVLAADDLDCIQCLLLLCLYGSNEPQSVNMWYTLGLALRLAIGIDLHRQETTSSSHSLLRSEMAKRLFWSVYVMDRSMSIALGRPLGVQNADISVPLPLQLTDEQLCSSQSNVLTVTPNLMPEIKDTSTFNHIIKLRKINADIYETFHAIGTSDEDYHALDAIRQKRYAELEAWLVAAPRYPPTTSMFQTTEWFQIAYHQAVLSLYRPSRGFPVSSVDALRFCVDSSISLISCYGALYAKNKVSYTFVALNSLFMAAVTLLHSLRASAAIRRGLTKTVAKANIDSCVGLLRGVSYGRAVGERCAGIIDRLGTATLAIFDHVSESDGQVDTEFMSWFGLKLQQWGAADPSSVDAVQPALSVDTPWNDLLELGFDMNMSGNVDLFL